MISKLLYYFFSINHVFDLLSQRAIGTYYYSFNEWQLCFFLDLYFFLLFSFSLFLLISFSSTTISFNLDFKIMFYRSYFSFNVLSYQVLKKVRKLRVRKVINLKINLRLCLLRWMFNFMSLIKLENQRVVQVNNLRLCLSKCIDIVFI